METGPYGETGYYYYVGTETGPSGYENGTDTLYISCDDYGDKRSASETVPVRRRFLECMNVGCHVWFDAGHDPQYQGLFQLQSNYTWARSDQLPVGTDIRSLQILFLHFRGRFEYMQSYPILFVYPHSSTPIRLGIDDIHGLYKTDFTLFSNPDGSEIVPPFNNNNPIHRRGYTSYFKYNSGKTEKRPTDTYNGLMYFDTTLDIPLWFNKTEWMSPMIRIFGNFVSTETQYSNKAKSGITFNTIVAASPKVTLLDNNSDVQVGVAGYYRIVYTAQCQKIVGSGTAFDITMWFKINTNDVPNSNRSVYLDSPGYYQQLHCDIVVFLEPGDKVQIFTSSGASGRNCIISTPATTNSPAIPSISFYIQRISRI